MNLLKVIGLIILGIFAIKIGLGLLASVVGFALKIGFTVLIFGAVLYGIYRLTGGTKALKGGRRLLD
jgi:hypothetical protein